MNNLRVEIENLTVTTKDRTILDSISLDFEAGRTHVILGPSGSGKTTLLRSVNRLNDLFPGLRVSGQVRLPWDDELRSIYGRLCSVESLRQRVGMVFQNPNILPVSVQENFRIPLESVLNLDRHQVTARMTEALTEAGLWMDVRDRLDEPAARLSGGQQQRLCLARALSLDPKVLLLDEPTANLDFRATAAIEKLIDRLKQKRVLLVVSHSLDQAARIADRVVAIDNGQVVLDRPVLNEQCIGELKNHLEDLFPGDQVA